MYHKIRCHVWHVHPSMLRVLCKYVWIDVCLQSVHGSSERTVQCRMHVLAGTRRMSAVCDVHARYAEKRYRSTHGLRDEWGVTAAAQVDRASARAEKQARLFAQRTRLAMHFVVSLIAHAGGFSCNQCRCAINQYQLGDAVHSIVLCSVMLY